MIRKVEISGVNTAKLPALSNEEKNELLIKIKDGDMIAREKFINGKTIYRSGFLLLLFLYSVL